MTPSYTHVSARERLPNHKAPFVCGNPACDEARPSPEGESFRALMSCPACGEMMFRAPWAKIVERDPAEVAGDDKPTPSMPEVDREEAPR